MLAILQKEIAAFFSSLIGYLVIGVFLLTSSLFLWILPGSMNILFGGYATLSGLFELAPWLYLFLVPAITMRLFSDEKKSGTIELLLTRPLSPLQIILGKYLAGLTLVVLSILPTLIYFYSVYQLSNPIGNMDTGATWGSFVGLFFLGGTYVAVGLFCSSLTDNQIIAFILSLAGCFIIYSGFQSIAQIPGLLKWQWHISNMGIDAHYQSISRGVIDSRDVIYFLSSITIFLSLTRLSIIRKHW